MDLTPVSIYHGAQLVTLPGLPWKSGALLTTQQQPGQPFLPCMFEGCIEESLARKAGFL